MEIHAEFLNSGDQLRMVEEGKLANLVIVNVTL